MDRSGSELFRAALERLIDVTFHALHGNVRQVTRLVADSLDENVEFDFARELAEFWTRAGVDGAEAVRAAQDFVSNVGSAVPAAQAQPITTAGPAAGVGTAAGNCPPYRQTFGPFRSADAVQPQALRRRGDMQPSIPSHQIKVTPASVTRNATELQIEVTCGGVARGIYTGALRVGSDEYPYNIYLDPT